MRRCPVCPGISDRSVRDDDWDKGNSQDVKPVLPGVGPRVIPVIVPKAIPEPKKEGPEDGLVLPKPLAVVSTVLFLIATLIL